jgi:N-methylhydantoinase B/oxoprolinase/acetone carboxylase alpha subunit
MPITTKKSHNSKLKIYSLCLKERKNEQDTEKDRSIKATSCKNLKKRLAFIFESISKEKYVQAINQSYQQGRYKQTLQ